jgi:uncharacterized SAM-binding protein YcdF (DUF218 family)
MHRSNRAQAFPRPAVENAQLLRESQAKDGLRTRHLPKKFFGIITRRERWGLSWSGWLLIAAAVILAASFAFSNLYSFLAVSHRVNTNMLVMEGWAHRYAIRAAADEFRAGSYQKVFTTGGPVTGNGGYVNDQQTAASVGAQALKRAGLPAELVQMVPSRTDDRDRTYSSAVALQKWLKAQNPEVRSFNVVTENTHARRSLYLFQRAFGDTVTIGVIPVRNPDYDAKYWWQYSEGVKEVLGEAIAYAYARFFFHPVALKDAERDRVKSLFSNSKD